MNKTNISVEYLVKMAVTCVVKGFSNSSRYLKKWKENLCKIHHVTREDEFCKCNPPFR